MGLGNATAFPCCGGETQNLKTNAGTGREVGEDEEKIFR